MTVSNKPALLIGRVGLSGGHFRRWRFLPGDVEVVSGAVKKRNGFGVFCRIAGSAKFFAAANCADSLNADYLAKFIAKLLDCWNPQPVNCVQRVTWSRFGFSFRRVWRPRHSAAAIQRFQEWAGWRSTVSADCYSVFIQIGIRPACPQRLAISDLAGVSLRSRSLQGERILFRWSIFGSFNAVRVYQRFRVVVGA